VPSVLHVGCGKHKLPDWLTDHDEVRLDIDPDVEPHIIASMVDMGDIGPFDMLYNSHALEHLYPHEVPAALREFLRVLKPGGFAVVVVPNLDGVKPDEEILYDSEAGPVCGLDMYYGMARLIALNPHMAHHSGFVPATLAQAMERAGFVNVTTQTLFGYSLLGVGVKA
jgi:ubiquinone/menaquinone biosynthesis C-methylase UbiE